MKKNQKLSDFRKEQGLTTKKMASKLGISQSLYEKVEFGQRTPSFFFLRRVKDVFPEIDVDEFFLPQNNT